MKGRKRAVISSNTVSLCGSDYLGSEIEVISSRASESNDSSMGLESQDVRKRQSTPLLGAFSPNISSMKGGLKALEASCDTPQNQLHKNENNSGFPSKIDFSKTPPSPLDYHLLKFANNPSSLRIVDSNQPLSEESKTDEKPTETTNQANKTSTRKSGVVSRLKFTISSNQNRGPGQNLIQTVKKTSKMLGLNSRQVTQLSSAKLEDYQDKAKLLPQIYGEIKKTQINTLLQNAELSSKSLLESQQRQVDYKLNSSSILDSSKLVQNDNQDETLDHMFKKFYKQPEPVPFVLTKKVINKNTQTPKTHLHQSQDYGFGQIRAFNPV